MVIKFEKVIIYGINKFNFEYNSFKINSQYILLSSLIRTLDFIFFFIILPQRLTQMMEADENEIMKSD